MTAALTEPTAVLPTIDPDDPADAFTPPPEPAAPVSAPSPAPRRKPGPPPDPNSARSRKRAKAAAAPPRRATPNRRTAPAPADPLTATYERGAIAVLGWVAQPLAMAGLGFGVAAETAPEGSPRARQLGKLGMALNLDAMTLAAYGPGLATGVAEVAGHIPWLAAGLQAAAKLSPFAALADAVAKIALQVMCNHGLMPANPVFGTLSPEQMYELVNPQGEPAPAPA